MANLEIKPRYKEVAAHSKTMIRRSQSNVQLYMQMHSAGYELLDIKEVKAAYGLAVESFSGYYRPSGKPFLSHLVGVASILTSLNEDTVIVIAGLLHAFYTHGSRHSLLYTSPIERPSKRLLRLRTFVQSKVGRQVEDLVYRYSCLKWSASALSHFLEAPSLSEVDRSVVTMRIANELEELEGKDVSSFGAGYFERLASLADKTNRGQLISTMEDSLSQSALSYSTDLLAEISSHGEFRRRGSFLAIPSHCMLKPWVSAMLRLRSVTGLWE